MNNTCCDTTCSTGVSKPPKNPAPIKVGVEDLTLGCGTELQQRDCQEVTITQINANHIMYCPAKRSVGFTLTKLLACVFPHGKDTLCERVDDLWACMFPSNKSDMCARMVNLEQELNRIKQCVDPVGGPPICDQVSKNAGKELMGAIRHTDGSITLNLKDGTTVEIPKA